jgi:hypothetical protein
MSRGTLVLLTALAAMDAGSTFRPKKARRSPEAAEYWRTYLRFDPSSEWGRYARQRLA